MSQPTHSNADVDVATSQMASLAGQGAPSPVPDLAAEISPDMLATWDHVGAGGFGDVYRFDHPTRGVLALKRVKEAGKSEVIKRHRRHARKEAEIWYGLNHPHVLKLAGILESDTAFCFVCPFLENGSLRDYLVENPTAALDRVQTIIECLSALAYLHQKGIIHGDIKAANVLLTEDLHAHICDFGLSRSTEMATTTSVVGKGSVRWMSPELLNNGRGKSFASDVWAVGMMIYEILSSRLPFEDHAQDIFIVMDIVVNKKLPPFEPIHSAGGETYTWIWRSVAECWNYEPNGRPSMDTLHHRIKYLRPPPTAAQLSPRGLSIRNGIPHEDLAQLPRRAKEKVAVLWAHSKAVPCIAFSPDSRTLASASCDKTIRLWDVVQAIPLGTPLEGHTDWVRSVAFSPDGTTLVSGSNDCTLRVWDVSTGRTIGEPLTGHTNWVWSVTFSPDGRTIASGSYDSTIRICDSVSRRCIAVLEGYINWVMGVAFSPYGKTFVSGSGDGTVRRWDVTTNAQIGKPMQGHANWVQSVAFSPDGSTITSGSDDGAIRLWDARSGEPKGSPLEGHTSSVCSVVFHPNGRLLASGSWDDTVRIWDLTTAPPTTRLVLRDHAGDVNSVAFSPDGKWLASGSDDRTVRLWDLEVLLGTI